MNRPRDRQKKRQEDDRRSHGSRHEHDDRNIDRREVEEIEQRSTPPTPIIYEVVRKLGQEEMERPVTSLWWSGVAAGLSISFSLLAQAILYTHLTDTSWRPLVTSFGYSVGLPDGRARAAATIHRKHAHGRSAAYGRTVAAQPRLDRADLGRRAVGQPCGDAVRRAVLHLHS